MLKSNKSKLRWFGIIVIGVILFGMQVFVGDDVWAQDQDLVFTPVTPCRIVDTRFQSEYDDEDNPFFKGDRSEYRVFGDDLSDQGGKKDGCPVPDDRGAPAAVHINVTAVPKSGIGWFVVFPADEEPPLASLVNYDGAVQNIANAATIKCEFPPADAEQIEVMNDGQNNVESNLVIDVMGYFYP